MIVFWNRYAGLGDKAAGIFWSPAIRAASSPPPGSGAGSLLLLGVGV